MTSARGCVVLVVCVLFEFRLLIVCCCFLLSYCDSVLNVYAMCVFMCICLHVSSMTSAWGCARPYEECTRLAETRLARNSLHFL